ncbi:MAG TPA: peptidylprolyl isomerase [Chloroflexia bacterium]|nr:peptidylprolyl isomerase [Chloroflexia bacterium]
MKGLVLMGAMAVLLVLTACGDAAPTAVPPTAPAAAAVPGHATVQHILIGFKGSVSGKNITRSQEEAKTLAYQLLAKAKGGSDFDQLVRENTDDSPPGIYSMSDTGVPAGKGEYPREGMVPAFGNVGFSLKPGEIGIADFDPATSPFGYHIIKRLK